MTFAKEWQPVSLAKLLGFAAGSACFFWLVGQSEPGGVFLIDHANLLFHEAGHPIVGLFSTRLEPYGGTFAQLLIPLILIISFWRKNQPIAVAATVIWFFENFLGIAHYMADARKLVLDLVGGGDHDWNNIFFRWNLLSYDTQIAGVVRTIGWIGMVLPCPWILWRWHADRKQPAGPESL